MNKKALCLIILLIVACTTYSQVAINALDPFAELDVNATNSGIPVLELKPQSAPLGTSDGQLAVIGDKLFQFDVTRNKWLSVETTTLEFLLEDRSTSDAVLTISYSYIDKSHLVDAPAAVMPFDGTIVYATSNFTNANDSKRFDIMIEDPTSAVVATLSPPIDKKSFQTDLDVDFNATDRIYVKFDSDGGSLRVPLVTLYVKWRE